MERVEFADAEMAWLEPGDDETGYMTGFDAGGWPASTWVLHAMYENPSLWGLGSHDDIHRQRLEAGTVAPLIIGEVNLDEGTTVTGSSLGFVVRPGCEWRRLCWAEYLDRIPDFKPNRAVPPSFRWFPPGSWPVAIEPPPEGSLDQESMEALFSVLVEHDTVRGAGEVFAYWAAIPASDFDARHLWRGDLGEVGSLLDEMGGPYPSSPTNLWASDRTWFVCTDWDLSGTKVSGPESPIEQIKSSPTLETTDWTRSE